ncbi:C-type lectin domain family 6 member A-like isoform X4 [Palaemon carinicauda]|uniref:C-type lectin domain family 6 member A-like isoform X4 n=1 Tax=Palaemon carinicauda TaxID=392227 RepID=UPI0035B5E5D5
MMKAFVLLVACLGASAYLPTSSEILRESKAYVCPDPFELIGGQCLIVDNFTKGTYQGMKQFCEMFQGRVVKIDNADTLRAITDHIYDNKLTTVSFWIGATDEAAEGTWQWDDETHVPMGTPFWANFGCSNNQAPDGDKQENCAVLDKDLHFYFNDVHCDSDAGVICEAVW